jgi:periplasmic divalent cation tolerance protein
VDRPAIIVTAAPDRATAERISQALVEGEIAAAVHIREVASRYRWKGEVVAGTEHVLDIYAPADALDAVRATIEKLHPYEMPGIALLPIADGPAPYLRWIATAGRDPA